MVDVLIVAAALFFLFEPIDNLRRRIAFDSSQDATAPSRQKVPPGEIRDLPARERL